VCCRVSRSRRFCDPTACAHSSTQVVINIHFLSTRSRINNTSNKSRSSREGPLVGPARCASTSIGPPHCMFILSHTHRDAGGRPARRLPGALPSPLSMAARPRLAAGEQSQPPLQHTCSRVNHVNHLHVMCTRRGPQPPRELAAHAATESRRAALAVLACLALTVCACGSGARLWVCACAGARMQGTSS
jgi:hypothetical protein